MPQSDQEEKKQSSSGGLQNFAADKIKQQLIKQAAAKLGAGVAGAGGATLSGVAAVAAPIIAVVALIIVVCVLLIIVVVLIFGGGAGGVAEGAESQLSVTFVSAPPKIEELNIGIVDVQYTLTITNNSTTTITGISVTFSGGCPSSITVPDMPPGGTPFQQTFTCPIDTNLVTPPGETHFNTPTITGTATQTQATQSAEPPQQFNVSFPPAIVTIGNPPNGPPVFWPLKSPVTITRPFKFVAAVYGCGYHLGTDIITSPSNWTVFSPFANVATVVAAETNSNNSSGYGQYVDLRSGDWIVRMAHMDPVKVNVGQAVDANTPLGTMDNTGLSEGSHVHFEVGNPSLAVGCSTEMLKDAATLGLTPHP